MDIVERLRNQARFGATSAAKVRLDAANEIERLRSVLQKIADIEHEDLPAPKTSNEGITWIVLAMAIGLSEKALKENE